MDKFKQTLKDEKPLRRTPSSPKFTIKKNKNLNFNKSIGYAKKKHVLQRELILESPKNKSERIATSPQQQILLTKTTEIITLNTENKENPCFQKFLTSHKIYFSNFSKYEQAKFSNKPYGAIAAYAANTNQGQVRDYNEDRVSIILNVVKPNSRQGEEWPKVSFFGIYDGHGGNKCSDFLKENLHHYVCSKFKDVYFN